MDRLRIPHLIVVILLLSLTYISIKAEPTYVEGELLVRFDEQYCPVTVDIDSSGNIVTGMASIDSLLALHQCDSMVKNYKGDLPQACGIYLLKFPAESNMEAIRDDFAADIHVLAADRNSLLVPDDTPNDPYFFQGSGQWCHFIGYMMSEKGWEISKGSQDIKIAVIDWGVDYEHPDLQDHIWFNSAEDYNQNGTYEKWEAWYGGDWDFQDNDLNGYYDDVVGWNFTVDPGLPAAKDPFPYEGSAFTHGTMVAGAAAAVTNNGVGIAGASWSSKIMVLKIGSVGQAVAAIDYAMDNGANVINMSFGDETPRENLRLKIEDAFNANIVLVAAAGNDHVSTPHYPAYYPQVIAVASAGSDSFKTAVSNFGSWVDVSAPSGNWLTSLYIYKNPNPDETIRIYEFRESGATSFAAPLVSGVAALIKATYPGLTSQQIMDTIRDPDNQTPTKWSPTSPQIPGMVNTLKCLSNKHGEYVSSSRTWGDPVDGKDTIYLSGDVLVEDNATLTILPGTVIKIVDHDLWLPKNDIGIDSTKVEITVQGSLIAVSEDPNNPIVFTAASNTPQSGHWVGIIIDSSSYSSAEVTLKNCRIENAYCGIEVRPPRVRQPTDILNTYIANCAVYGIYAATSGLTVRGCHIEDIGTPNGYGVYLYHSSPLIVSDTIVDCYYGIYADSSFPRIDSILVQKVTLGSMGIRRYLLGAIPATNLELTRSAFTGSFSYGVYNYRGRMTVDSCFVDGATYTGISNAAGSTITVRRTKITNYQNYGFLNSATGSSADLGNADWLVDDPGLNSIKPNDCNKKAVAILGGADNVIAEGNYWGTVLGKDPVPCWFSTGVDFDPWLDDDPGFYMYLASQLLPTSDGLMTNRPNPFNSQTIIQLNLPRAGATTLTIYNVLGQRVRTLLNEELQTGRHEIVWDGTDDFNHKVASGVYFYQLKVAEFKQSRKMVFLR